jgi:hypothetical protein
MEDMKGWVEKLSSITAELKAALPDSNPFAEILNKIYKKKIKRNKAGADGEEEEEEEEEEDGDDDDEEEEVEDICPIGCDRLLYDRILELRDRRTEVDEMIAEIQKSIDDLKKTTDRLKQREKQILKDAVQAELEVQQFQLQKQASLNQINVVVPLNMSQIYTFNGSGAFTGPTDGAVGAGEGTDEHAATASQTGAATAVAAATAGAGAVVAAEDGEQAAEEGSQNGGTCGCVFPRAGPWVLTFVPLPHPPLQQSWKSFATQRCVTSSRTLISIPTSSSRKRTCCACKNASVSSTRRSSKSGTPCTICTRNASG